MKAQVLFVDGPYDMHLATYTSLLDLPVELRLANKEGFDGWAAWYRLRDWEEAPLSVMKFASYQFVDVRPSAESLINLWIEGKSGGLAPSSGNEKEEEGVEDE